MAPPLVHDVLRSPGVPLAAADRHIYASALGGDLSRVRLHTDDRAASSAEAVGAQAYTVGNHVVFSHGAYAPGTQDGRHILAHELAHVAQQAGTDIVPGRLRVGDSHDATEVQAERFARTLQAPPPASRAEVVLSRYSHKNCAEADLHDSIWPADHLARQMVLDAMAAVTAKPIGAGALFADYFMTPTPDFLTVLTPFAKVGQAFADNDYTYECHEKCEDKEELAHVSNIGSIRYGNIHLCMNKLRSNPNNCFANTIVHEFMHRFADMSDHLYCHTGCLIGCPGGMTVDEALDNADSYAGFAYEAHKLL